VLSEQSVLNRWRGLVSSGPVSREDVRTARALIRQLPPESPLRIRLASELDELQALIKRSSTRTSSRT
jgi:hypothetical protein